MKTIKVSEATSIQLDWLVAKCNGDFTQNIVNDALYEVGYYTEEEDDQTL